MLEVAIFNHLDIKVLVHPNLFTKYQATTDERDAKISQKIGNINLSIPLP